MLEGVRRGRPWTVTSQRTGYCGKEKDNNGGGLAKGRADGRAGRGRLRDRERLGGTFRAHG